MTRSAWCPIEPVEPRRAIRTGVSSPELKGAMGASRKPSADDGKDIRVHHRRCEEQRIDAVEDAPVAGEERARVLGAGGPLEHRFGKVAGLGGDGHERTEKQRVERCSTETPQRSEERRVGKECRS